MGRASQVVGALFEAWIESQHDKALDLGILAHPATHNQAITKVIGGRLIYEKPGIADYTGTLTRGAVTLAVEAKSTQLGYLPRLAITQKQQMHLSAVAVAGGISLLLVEFRKDHINDRYAVPWALVPWGVKRTAESVDEDAITKWHIPPQTECYLERFHTRGPAVEGVVRKRIYPRE